MFYGCFTLSRNCTFLLKERQENRQKLLRGEGIVGSRIMHLIIANRIAECLSLEDRTTFLFGGIAPDAPLNKNLSHFFTGDVQDYSRSIDYKGFIHKYSSQVESHYILGYFTHLIADDIWLKGFYLPWLKNRLEANNELFNLYHNDFQLLNGKLLEHYGFPDQLRKMLSLPHKILDLQETKSKDVEEFIPHVLADMEYDQGIINEKLNVFTFDQIIGYIETSVDKGVISIKSFIS